MKTYTYLVMISLLFCAGCDTDFTPQIESEHHQESKYKRFMRQCTDADKYICLDRYNKMAIE